VVEYTQVLSEEDERALLVGEGHTEPRGFISAGLGDFVKARVPRRLASERLVDRAILGREHGKELCSLARDSRTRLRTREDLVGWP
jgi:hypothetical protein